MFHMFHHDAGPRVPRSELLEQAALRKMSQTRPVVPQTEAVANWG